MSKIVIAAIVAFSATVSAQMPNTTTNGTSNTFNATPLLNGNYPQASLNLTAFTTYTVPQYPCTADSNCTYLNMFGLPGVCCATWKSQPISLRAINSTSNITTLGSACMLANTNFYTTQFNSSTTAVWFNCSSSWVSFVPDNWQAVNQTGCTTNSQCGAGNCCNNNNGSYMGITNSNWEPDNFCMNATSDKSVFSFTSNISAMNFQVYAQCQSTAALYAGQMTTMSGTGSNAINLLLAFTTIISLIALALF